MQVESPPQPRHCAGTHWATTRAPFSAATSVIRSYRYHLGPTVAQERTLDVWLRLTRELFNAALQERRDAWAKQRIRVTLYDQMKELPGVREVRPEFNAIPVVVLRGVLRRLDRAFVAFVADAGWASFLWWLRVKAEEAGREVIAVNPVGTSQTCPECGIVKAKTLNEREHRCECGLTCDRDVAAARVILGLGTSLRRAAPLVEGQRRPEKSKSVRRPGHTIADGRAAG